MKRGTSGINALFAVDKPYGLSSHDVVGRVRRILGERRVGHAGTLDPAASGVLVLGVGQATRLMGMLTADRKSYLASIAFGRSTTTDDAEGETLFTGEVPARVATEDFARETLASLVGEQLQVPPKFSAISVDGKRAYAQARKGEDVQLEPRKVHIYSADLLSVSTEEDVVWVCRLEVSKGTYIRSIARDLGQELGCGAHLAGLRRLSSGNIGLDATVSLEELEEKAEAWEELALDPVQALDLPVLNLRPDERIAAGQGRKLLVDGERIQGADSGKVCLVADGKLYGVWNNGAGLLSCDVNFPEGIAGVHENA